MTEYIFKSSVGIAIAYLLYFCLLRNNTRFKWVRIYFYVSVAASLAFPALSSYFATRNQVWVQIPSYYIREFLKDGTNNIEAPPIAAAWTIMTGLAFYLKLIYFAGLTFVLAHFLTGLIKLFYFIFKFGAQKNGSDRLVIIPDLPYPFSFLQFIFINRQTLSEANHKAILLHERAHIRQWHTLDLFLLELLAAFQWFNPFVWLYRRSVKDLHEYLADEAVLKSEKSPLDYQLLVFSQASGYSMSWPVNGFGSSITKKRILMINNKKHKKWYAVAAVMIVAIFAIQSVTRVNLAQDPPKKQKGALKQNSDTSVWKYPPPPPPPPPPADGKRKVKMDVQTTITIPDTGDMPVPPPPPPPPPSPLFNGTNNFRESNAAFGDFIMKNVNLPAEFTSKKTGVFVLITFDKHGKVVSAEKGNTPEDFEADYGTEISENPDLLSEVIKAVKKAPDFKLEDKDDETQCKVNYCIVFNQNNCKVLPVDFFYKVILDRPAKSQAVHGNIKGGI